MPQTPFRTLAIDINGPLHTNLYLLVLVDYHSTYPFVYFFVYGHLDISWAIIAESSLLHMASSRTRTIFQVQFAKH